MTEFGFRFEAEIPFYRLNVFPVTIPSLSQRKEDIPLLVTHFTQKFSRDYILRTLQETGWRIEGPRGAAKILEINPNTLRNRMR
jgi:transcriptional regulator with GAF, ATPase, and Fis domain